MEKFADIYQRAADRKCGELMLQSLLNEPEPKALVAKVTNSQWLEEFTRKIFQSAFYWSVINNKWSGFREVFWDFDVEKLLMIPPEMLENKATDQRIVRNYTKVKTIPINALMIHQTSEEHGSFDQFIADWPIEDTIGLWHWLKQHGSRLGGNTGPYTLRVMGKDTFLLSRDVESYLRANDIITGGLQSKRSLQSIQHFFNEMRQQSGLSLQQISKTVSYSCGDNVVGMVTTEQ